MDPDDRAPFIPEDCRSDSLLLGRDTPSPQTVQSLALNDTTVEYFNTHSSPKSPSANIVSEAINTTAQTSTEKASKIFYLADNSSSSPESDTVLPLRGSSESIASNSSNNSISSMYHSALTESVQSASSSQSTVTPNTSLTDEASSLVKTNPLNPNATVFIPRQVNNLQLNP